MILSPSSGIGLRPKVLHLSKTPIAGAPGMLSSLICRYSAWDSQVFAQRTKVTAGDFSTAYEDAVAREFLEVSVRSADILHFHNTGPNEWPDLPVKDKPYVVQIHTDPTSMGRLVKAYPGRCVTLAQKYALMDEYQGLPIVPNVLPIHDEEYLPGARKEDKVVIAYSPTNTIQMGCYENNCSSKGYYETMPVLERIQERFGDAVELRIMKGMPKDTVLGFKRGADIQIDEVVTGGYHLSSLEGLSMGSLTVANIKPEMAGVLTAITGCELDELPWYELTVPELEIGLRAAVNLKLEAPARFMELCHRGRRWMEKYWRPDKMVEKYVRLYDAKLGRKYNPWAGLTISADPEGLRKRQSKCYTAADLQQPDKEFKVRDMEGEHAGTPALILASGPSAGRIDIDEFIEVNDPVLFTCNYSHLLTKYVPEYWTSIDATVLKDMVSKIELPRDTRAIVTQFNDYFRPFPNARLWTSRAAGELNKRFLFDYELLRPCTVATVMTLFAMLAGCDPIYIIGVDLSTEKGAKNYAYSAGEPGLNHKFRDFSSNYLHIIREFRWMREDAKCRGIDIYNLDPEPINFDVFPIMEG